MALLLAEKKPLAASNAVSPAQGTLAETSTLKADTTTIPTTDKHASDNLATEQAESSPAPSLDTGSPALAQFNQAMALLNAGLKGNNITDLKNAAEAFDLVTQTYPDETYANKAFVHGGNAYFKLGNIDEAQRCFKIAITKPLDTQNAIHARLGYGETLLAKNNKEDACAQLKALSKETLDVEQKKRFEAIKESASCTIEKSKGAESKAGG